MSIFSFHSMYDVLTIGSATRDIFLVSDQFFTMKTSASESGTAECVSLGSKIEINKFFSATGGGATNAAATFRSLGYKTAVMARIGDDDVGKSIMEELKRSRIETKLLRQIPFGQTAYSTLLTMPEGERTVLVFRGVSSTFQESDIYWSAIKKSKWIYLTSLGGQLTLSKKIIEFAHKNKVKIAWNPGTAELKKGLKSFSSFLPFVDVFLINKEEGELLTGGPTVKQILSVIKHPGKIRLVTDGKRGTTFFDGTASFHVGTTGAKGISKTGAGDAFGSGFVAGLIKKQDAKFAARVGTLNAESVIQHLGAKKGILAEWPSASKQTKIKIV